MCYIKKIQLKSLKNNVELILKRKFVDLHSPIPFTNSGFCYAFYLLLFWGY